MSMKTPVTKHQTRNKFETRLDIWILVIRNYLRFEIWDLGFARRGFSIVETLVAVGVLGLMVVAVGAFQGNIFGLNTSLNNQLTGQNEARRTIEEITASLRTATIANNGSFPLETVADTTLTFYANIDGDPDMERVRYFVSGTDLKKGVIQPSGSPAVYTGAETITNSVSGIANGATPIFTYYDANYSGSGAPLTQPVMPASVRYIHIALIIDKDTKRPPAAFRMEGGVNVRNLKDNL